MYFVRFHFRGYFAKDVREILALFDVKDVDGSCDTCMYDGCYCYRHGAAAEEIR